MTPNTGNPYADFLATWGLSQMNWTIVSGAVALYGALLSTLNAVSSFREKRRQVMVEAAYGFEAYGPGIGPNSMILTARNKGYQSVSLTSAGIRLPDGRDAVYLRQSGDTCFPHELEGGKSCTVCIPFQSFAGPFKQEGLSGTIRLSGYFRDALGKTHTSKRFKFNLDRPPTE
jgi:hypothetical protein